MLVFNWAYYSNFIQLNVKELRPSGGAVARDEDEGNGMP
jgi:hypothetical protein